MFTFLRPPRSALRIVCRTAIAVFGLLAGLLGSTLNGAARSSDALYLHPGRLVDIGGYRLNIVCAGHGAPTVVFDAGLEDWSPSWSRVQPSIAPTTRTCSYDRAGNGASDAGPAPRTSARIVTELHALLAAAGEKPPYLLVGHSFGGYTVRLFADRYLADVAGIVLVDSSHEDQGRIEAAVSPDSRREWRDMLTGLQRCERLATARAGRWTGPTEAACTSQFFRGLPERTFSAALNATLRAQAHAPKQYAASYGEAAYFGTTSADEVRAARRAWGSVPLRILTGAHHFPETAATPVAQRERDRQFERGWQALQQSWCALSTNSRRTLARHSGHYVQLDQPELVIAAIREEIALFRRARHLI